MINKTAELKLRRMKDEIKNIVDEIKKLREEKRKVVMPYDKKIQELSMRYTELKSELKKLEYKLSVDFVKSAKNKISLAELIEKGTGTFGDYRYFLKSGREVSPVLVLQLNDDFEEKANYEDFKEFKEYVKRIAGDDIKTIEVRYGYINSILANKETPIETVRNLLKNGFVIGWNGEINVVGIHTYMRYYRNINQIVVVKRGAENE